MAHMLTKPGRQLTKGLLVLLLVLHSSVGCATSQPEPVASDPNPAAADFDLEGSDPRAVAIADETMAAMGGRRAWDQTRYLTWRFFGRRLHVWDKHRGDIRVEWGSSGSPDHVVVLMNVDTRRGRAWQGGTEVTETAELAALLKRGYEAWVNDAYWLVMPYKLKDSGVTLAYRGEDLMENGRKSDVLELTFDGVGVTPQNKYRVYVARDTKLVVQWAYYPEAVHTEPSYVGPWHNWRRYGRILLSANHGSGRVHTDVAAPEHLPRSVFTDPAPVDLVR